MQFTQHTDSLTEACSSVCSKLHLTPNAPVTAQHLKSTISAICDVTADQQHAGDIRKSLMVAIVNAIRAHSLRMSESQRKQMAEILQREDTVVPLALDSLGSEPKHDTWPMNLMQVVLFTASQEKINAWFFQFACLLPCLFVYGILNSERGFLGWTLFVSSKHKILHPKCQFISLRPMPKKWAPLSCTRTVSTFAFTFQRTECFCG